MREMDLYSDKEARRDAEYLQTLLKFKKSYMQLCDDIANFYTFNKRGMATSVDAQALAEFLRPFAEQINTRR